MTAHELGRHLLDAPDVPVHAFGARDEFLVEAVDIWCRVNDASKVEPETVFLTGVRVGV